MLEQISRRIFLKATPALVAGTMATGCGGLYEEAERLSGDLEGLIEAIATEVRKRGSKSELRESLGYKSQFTTKYELDRFESHWREPVFTAISEDLHKTRPYDEASTIVYRSRDDLRNKRDSMRKLFPFYVTPITVVFENDSGNERNPLGNYYMRIKVSGNGYTDEFSFSTWGHLGPYWQTGREDRSIFYTSRKRNLKNMQTAFGISEQEATKRLNEMIPRLLQNAGDYLVTPSNLPNEEWIPKNMQGVPIGQLKTHLERQPTYERFFK